MNTTFWTSFANALYRCPVKTTPPRDEMRRQHPLESFFDHSFRDKAHALTNHILSGLALIALCFRRGTISETYGNSLSKMLLLKK